MPHAFPHSCTYPGCRTLVTGTNRCTKHAYVVSADYDARRGNTTARGYGYHWQTFRRRYLRANPICVHCQRAGILTPANEIDHITPHRGNDVLMWDENNMQPLCKSCHSRKTVTEDGAFSRPLRI